MKNRRALASQQAASHTRPVYTVRALLHNAVADVCKVTVTVQDVSKRKAAASDNGLIKVFFLSQL